MIDGYGNIDILQVEILYHSNKKVLRQRLENITLFHLERFVRNNKNLPKHIVNLFKNTIKIRRKKYNMGIYS